MGDQNVYPGPVDNSGLLRGETWVIQLFACSVTIKKYPCSLINTAFTILEVATEFRGGGTKTKQNTDE